MGITISNQPSAGAAALGSWLGGAGQYRKYLEQMALQQQEAQQRERMQLRALAAQAQEQASNQAHQQNMWAANQAANQQEMGWKANLARQQALWENAQRQGQMAQQFEQQKQLMGLQQQHAFAFQGKQNEDRQAGFAADDARRVEQFKTQEQFKQQQKQNAFDAWTQFNNNDEELQNFRDAIQYEATPEGGGMVLDKSSSDRMAAIRRQRELIGQSILNNGLTADQARAAHERLKREEMSIRPTVKQPTPEEELQKSRVREVDPESGRVTEYIKDGNGVFKKQMPEKTNPDLVREGYQKDVAKELIKSDDPAVRKRGYKLLQDMGILEPEGEEAPAPQPVPEPAPQPTQQMESRVGNAVQGAMAGGIIGPGPAIAGGIYGAARTPQPIQQGPPQDHRQADQPEDQLKFVPASKEESAKNPRIAGSVGGRPVVRVTSRDEAVKLPPGTFFITPDGRLKRVPAAA